MDIDDARVSPGDVAQAIADLPALLRAERKRRGLGLRAAVRETAVTYHVYKRTEEGGLPSAQHAMELFAWLAASYSHPDLDASGCPA